MRHPNVYGIDMPSACEFVAHDASEEEVSNRIGADWLVYQELEDLIECATEGNPEITTYETSIFDGKYVTGDVDQRYLSKIETFRSDSAKDVSMPDGEQTDDEVIELHNQE